MPPQKKFAPQKLICRAIILPRERQRVLRRIIIPARSTIASPDAETLAQPPPELVILFVVVDSESLVVSDVSNFRLSALYHVSPFSDTSTGIEYTPSFVTPDFVVAVMVIVSVGIVPAVAGSISTASNPSAFSAARNDPEIDAVRVPMRHNTG